MRLARLPALGNVYAHVLQLLGAQPLGPFSLAHSTSACQHAKSHTRATPPHRANAFGAIFLTVTITSGEHRISEFGPTMFNLDLGDAGNLATVGGSVVGGLVAVFQLFSKLDQLFSKLELLEKGLNEVKNEVTDGKKEVKEEFDKVKKEVKEEFDKVNEANKDEAEKNEKRYIDFLNQMSGVQKDLGILLGRFLERDSQIKTAHAQEQRGTPSEPSSNEGNTPSEPSSKEGNTPSEP